MFRRFLLHKAIRDKGLLLILPKPPLCPRLLLGTFVGNVYSGFFFSSASPGFPAASASLGLGASTALAWPFLAAGFSGVWVCRTVWISETVTGIRLNLGSQSMGRSLMVGSRNRMMAGVTLGSSRISL